MFKFKLFKIFPKPQLLSKTHSNINRNLEKKKSTHIVSSPKIDCVQNMFGPYLKFPNPRKTSALRDPRKLVWKSTRLDYAQRNRPTLYEKKRPREEKAFGKTRAGKSRTWGGKVMRAICGARETRTAVYSGTARSQTRNREQSDLFIKANRNLAARFMKPPLLFAPVVGAETTKIAPLSRLISRGREARFSPFSGVFLKLWR